TEDAGGGVGEGAPGLDTGGVAAGAPVTVAAGAGAGTAAAISPPAPPPPHPATPIRAALQNNCASPLRFPSFLNSYLDLYLDNSANCGRGFPHTTVTGCKRCEARRYES